MARYSSLSSEDLVKACAGSNNPAAWEEFIRRFQRVIATVVMRTARRWGDHPLQLVDDLVQDTYLKLCDDDSRLLRSFEAHHSGAIFGFLKVVATNVVHDHFKASLAGKRGAGKIDAYEGDPSPAAKNSNSGSEGLERRIMLRQVAEALNRVAEGEEQRRNRIIFWLHYRHGMSASAIASLPAIGLTTKGVESTIFRMTRMIRSHIIENHAAALGKKSDGEGFSRAKSFS